MLPSVSFRQEFKSRMASATISDDKGNVIFNQDNIEAPEQWSDLAVKVAASKYFYGDPTKPGERETSIFALVSRVVDTIATWGLKDGYFSDSDEASRFSAELSALCLGQYGTFNSPVWFNTGLWHKYGAGGKSVGNWHVTEDGQHAHRCTTQYEFPQVSACFIISVEDNMDSIMSLASSEATLFKFGSGSGTSLSTIRSSRERMSGGGRPSGPMSFLKIYDQVANVVKSGGKTRRAAKINTLHDWHGDIEEFIVAKMNEEKKAHALIEAGYEANFNGEAYSTVAYQNENLSVRASDNFMLTATREVDNAQWNTFAVTTGEILETKNASKMLDQIAEGTWFCGDPGLQFDNTIQAWHTCPADGKINSTNPCSEYLFLDNTACNLASLNLVKFEKPDGQFDWERFRAAVEIFILAQDIIVDNASYPTAEIAVNSHKYRTLGLGFANLGALLMRCGLPYDSERSHLLASDISSVMTATAYCQSARIAARKGAFERFNANKEHMLRVIAQHRSVAAELGAEGLDLWDAAYELGEMHGFRNAQTTVIAPTGTISFMMDCDTTGIEPDLSLVKYKALAGRGNLKIVNNSVETALRRLGYQDDQVSKILEYILEHDTIESYGENNSPLDYVDLPVFDCSFKPHLGERFIRWEAHVDMMAAVQPFVSGAISKTINMPEKSTVADVREAYIYAWKHGLKCVAIYRDGSKRSQPLSTKAEGSAKESLEQLYKKKFEEEFDKALAKALKDARPEGPVRRRLPDLRKSLTHKFDISGHTGYMTVGLYNDGSPGELFITMAKEGSTVGGLMDSIGILTSLCFQYGVPLETMVKKFSHVRFEPMGFTNNDAIKNASSLVDYIYRWLDRQFSTPAKSGMDIEIEDIDLKPMVKVVKKAAGSVELDSPMCPECGHATVRSGTCHRCPNCGISLGCS